MESGKWKVESGKWKVGSGKWEVLKLHFMDNGISDKSLKFAIRVVKLYQYLTEHRKEFVLSKQFLRSGTAIGALIREAEHAQSKADFLNKMNISLKEANETLYWIILLNETGYLSVEEFQSIQKRCRRTCKNVSLDSKNHETKT